MDVKVHFRFNKRTGEVEVFTIEDQETMRLSEAEHNREHDRIAAEVGRVVERSPRVLEVFQETPLTTIHERVKDTSDGQTGEEPETSAEKQKETE